MKIKIKNLRLRCIIGFKPWEREKPQDVTVNIEFISSQEKAVQTDNIDDSVDYKKLKYKIVKCVEQSSFYLVEKLAGQILSIIMEDERINEATVEVDKPHALRFADSVSISLTSKRSQ